MRAVAAPPRAPDRKAAFPRLPSGEDAVLRSAPPLTVLSLVRIVPYLILLALTVALLWPLFLGRTLYWGDLTLYFEPVYRYAGEALKQGRVPLWNPYVLCGQPFLGNPQMSVFYPASLLLFFVPAWLYLSIDSALHLFLCGAFTYRYLLRWTSGRSESWPGTVPALAGAAVYMGSACLVGRIQFPPMIQTAAYFPLLLLCLDACIDRPRASAWAGLAIAVALTILAAHAQFSYLILFCGGAYTLMRLWHWNRQERNLSAHPRHRLARRLLPFLAVGLLGLLLAAIQVLPTLQLFRDSTREQMTANQANRFVLKPEQLLTLLFPRFFGHPASADYWGAGNAWEPALFIGWLPLLCIGFALWRLHRRRLVRFWAIVAGIGLWLALGESGGLYWVAYAVVPGISNFHDPARFLLVTTFAFAVLTGVGLNAMHWRRRGPYVPALALLGILAPLWWYGRDWNPTTSPVVFRRPPLPPSTLAALRQDRVYSPWKELVWHRYVDYGDYGPDDVGTIDAFMATLLPNNGMRYALSEASGYEPVPIQASTELDALARTALRRGEPNASRLLDLLSVKKALFPMGAGIADPRLHQDSSLKLRAWDNLDPVPAAWLVRRTRHVEGVKRILAALAAPDFAPRRLAILSGALPPSQDLEWGRGQSQDEATLPVTMTMRRATSLDLRADAGSGPAFLVLSVAAYPGWKATLDGAPASLFRSDGALMGLPLPPGAHRIHLTYAPDDFRVGAYITLFAMGALAAFLVAWRVPPGRKTPRLGRT